LTTSLLSLVVALLACGCGGAAPGSLTDELVAPPPDISAACDLAGHRCSRCHPIERLTLAQVSRPEHWARYVERMRRQPESGISEAEGQTITRCLVFRSFGPAGLRMFEEGRP
jgi:hypothetical protein